MKYSIGDIVVYRPHLGGTRIVLVDEKDEDIKNGRPGFGGTVVDEELSVWGYDSQIVSVHRS